MPPVAMPVRRLCLARRVAALLGPAGATPQTAPAGDRDHLRDHRPRLGPRRRDDPVGRVRLREARLHLRQDPRPLLPRHDARARAGREDQGAAGRGATGGRRLVARSLHGRGRRRGHAPARRPATTRSTRALGAAPTRRSPPRRCPGRSASSPGKSPLWLAHPYRGTLDRRRRRQERSPWSTRAARLVRRAGSSPARCRTTGRSRRSRRRRSPRAPTRSRTGAAARSTSTTTRATRSTAGSDRDAGRRPGGRRDEAPGAPLRRQGRDDVLLLELGRADRGDHRRVRRREADAVPRLGPRPVRHRVAPWHTWGPVVVPAATASQAARRSRGRRPAAGARDRPRASVRRRPAATATSPSRGGDVRRALGLRSTWLTKIGVLSLSRPAGAVAAGTAGHAQRPGRAGGRRPVLEQRDGRRRLAGRPGAHAPARRDVLARR